MFVNNRLFSHSLYTFCGSRIVRWLVVLLQTIEDKLRISVKELLKFEFQAVVALEFDLHIPQWEVLPHVKRLETE